MRNGEMGVKYVKDGEVGWTPIVRRRKTEESGSSGNLNVNDEGKKRSLVIQEHGQDTGNFYPRKLEGFKIGGSETQPYCLKN